MEILKPGTYEKPTYIFSCNKCGCIYKCNESELKHEQLDGMYLGHAYTNCPTCNAHLPVDLFAKVTHNG